MKNSYDNHPFVRISKKYSLNSVHITLFAAALLPLAGLIEGIQKNETKPFAFAAFFSVVFIFLYLTRNQYQRSKNQKADLGLFCIAKCFSVFSIIMIYMNCFKEDRMLFYSILILWVPFAEFLFSSKLMQDIMMFLRVLLVAFSIIYWKMHIAN